MVVPPNGSCNTTIHAVEKWGRKKHPRDDSLPRRARERKAREDALAQEVPNGRPGSILLEVSWLVNHWFPLIRPCFWGGYVGGRLTSHESWLVFTWYLYTSTFHSVCQLENLGDGELTPCNGTIWHPNWKVQVISIYIQYLGGGFKHFLFSPLFGEDSHFD